LRPVDVSLDLGIVAREPAPDVIELCVEAEELGFGGLWVADSQGIFRDAFAILAVAAARTKRILLSTGVTNPVTRHPAVLAGSFATLAELAPGRVVLTLGRGESAVFTIGARPATTKRLAQSVHALRALLAGETVSWDGGEARITWPACSVPIYLAASGPRTLRLAGRIADGVLFQVGADPRLVSWALAQVEAGAREAGRTLDDLTLCARVGCSVDEDRAWAREEMKPYAAVAAKTSFDAIPAEELPDDLLEDAHELRARYDYHQHAHGQAQHRHLVTERLLDAVSIAGTPAEAAPRLRALAELGVDRIVAPIVVSDSLRLVRTLAEHILPAFRSFDGS
jgi:5,10-methylenetetrahydromethanopterin reductase